MDVLDEQPSSFLVVAADHPSLIEARERFAAALRSEQRFFGRASADPKPFPSLIAKLLADDGLRLAAAVDGEIIGLACLRADGEVAVAVVEEWRGRGVATALVRAVTARGPQLRASDGSSSARAVAAAPSRRSAMPSVPPSSTSVAVASSSSSTPEPTPAPPDIPTTRSDGRHCLLSQQLLLH